MNPIALSCRGITLRFPCRPLVMGIVNLSADSFSGDGRPNIDAALEIAARLLDQGANLLDVGAESARTNRGPIAPGEEIARLVPFIDRFCHRHPGVLLSVNTWRPEVADAALETGGHLLNDLSGLPDPRNAQICARHRAALVLMHTVGAPKIPHTHVRYADVMSELDRFFEDRIALAVDAGLPRDAILIDPGIDFAKQKADNLTILRDLVRLQRFERPILLPVSRKTVVGDVLRIAEPSDRDAGTVACIVAGMLNGASIFRVHNVRAAVDAIRMISRVTGEPAAKDKSIADPLPPA